MSLALHAALAACHEKRASLADKLVLAGSGVSLPFTGFYPALGGAALGLTMSHLAEAPFAKGLLKSPSLAGVAGMVLGSYLTNKIIKRNLAAIQAEEQYRFGRPLPDALYNNTMF